MKLMENNDFQKLLAETRDICMGTMPGSGCPSVDQLVDYAIGSLESPEREKVEFHLPECLACRLVTIRVLASRSLWMGMLKNNTVKSLAMVLAAD